LDDEGVVVKVQSSDSAARQVSELLSRFKKVLVQEGVPGRKATVNFCIVNGRILAESMCVALHENPHTGGLTSLRHTWWHQAMRDDAYARVTHLGWQGVAMMEYKWDDKAKQFCFIEMNSRYWAALHLDLFAGTDFPKIQLDAFLGIENSCSPGRQRPLVCRHTFPADFGYAVSRARDPDVPLSSRLWAVLEFFALGLRPGVKVDLLFPGDRKLYFYQVKEFVTGLLKRTVD
jgi:hypothetical protein